MGFLHVILKHTTQRVSLSSQVHIEALKPCPGARTSVRSTAVHTGPKNTTRLWSEAPEPSAPIV